MTTSQLLPEVWYEQFDDKANGKPNFQPRSWRAKCYRLTDNDGRMATEEVLP